MYQENITALKKDAPIGVFDSGMTADTRIPCHTTLRNFS